VRVLRIKLCVRFVVASLLIHFPFSLWEGVAVR
jgi:hypothetical protein